MTEPQDRKLQAIFLIVLALSITAVFFHMVRSFVETLFLAAVFSGMMYGSYRRLANWTGGRKSTASALTVGLFVLVLLVPLLAFLGVVVSQAIEVSASVGPWVEREIAHTNRLDELLARLPFWDVIQPYQDLISTKIAEFAGRLGTILVGLVAAASRGTAVFFFQLFIMLYAMFFFLLHGKQYLARVLYYLPLAPDAENRLVGKFVSVARATIKGTLVIGIVQGGLAGLAFLAAGIHGWAFWSVVMMILSIIPGIGTALVWVPAVIYLFAMGSAARAVVLLVWCVVVVGMVDNVLRPRLVGRDTQMSDLLVLVSTLGGIIAFGAAGFIIGPIVAALWVTVWEIYGEAFSSFLPRVEMPVTDTVAGMPMVVPPGADSSPRQMESTDTPRLWPTEDPTPSDAEATAAAGDEPPGAEDGPSR
jgi:predicted PurR-regulated permease PerM